MGLIDKFKNLFTDEEIIEEEINDPIEIKEVKKEEEVHKLPTFMRERLDKEEQKENLDMELDLDFKKEFKLDTKIGLEEETSKSEEKNSFKFPLEFNDSDFIETRSRHKTHNKALKEEQIISSKETTKELPKQEKKETKVRELYKEKKQEVKKFKATPIISPIYGILDKNYISSDVENYKGENLEEKRHSKNVDFDSVRKKAYGNLSKELKENLICENCEYLKEAKECQKTKKQEVAENMVYEVLNENYEDYDYYSNITLDEATENYYDYGVEYKKNIKPRLEEDIKINNSEVEEKIKSTRKEIPPVKSSINLLSTLKKSMGNEEEKKNLELTDDLFNLIDSMYDERND